MPATTSDTIPPHIQGVHVLRPDNLSFLSLHEITKWGVIREKSITFNVATRLHRRHGNPLSVLNYVNDTSALAPYVRAIKFLIKSLAGQPWYHKLQTNGIEGVCRGFKTKGLGGVWERIWPSVTTHIACSRVCEGDFARSTNLKRVLWGMCWRVEL